MAHLTQFLNSICLSSNKKNDKVCQRQKNTVEEKRQVSESDSDITLTELSDKGFKITIINTPGF
jgi:hypothetical protein